MSHYRWLGHEPRRETVVCERTETLLLHSCLDHDAADKRRMHMVYGGVRRWWLCFAVHDDREMTFCRYARCLSHVGSVSRPHETWCPLAAAQHWMPKACCSRYTAAPTFATFGGTRAVIDFEGLMWLGIFIFISLPDLLSVPWSHGTSSALCLADGEECIYCKNKVALFQLNWWLQKDTIC